MDQKNSYEHSYIEREEYFRRLIGFRDKHVIKIITGIRRCGKSTLLEMFRRYLLANGVAPERIIAINFEDYDNRDLLNPDKLHLHIRRLISDSDMDKKTYVFLDEIQNVPEFQKVADSLHIRKNLDLYLTGSNAHMLSGDLATLLSGRYVEIEMLPLSFKEYVAAAGASLSLARAYADYLENSSFPGALEFAGNQEQIREYLRGVYNAVIVKDVASRYQISNAMMLESLSYLVFDNIGNRLSTKNISDTMSAAGRKIDVKTVERYLRALTDSYVFYQAKRYDVKGKQHLKTLEKYYAADVGMRYALLGKKGADVGWVLENVVYLELLRRGYQVYVGKVDDLEVDFAALNQDGVTYFQVAATVRQQTTLSRELAPLRKIADHYPKYVLTLDEDPDADYDGIKIINALRWLLGRDIVEGVIMMKQSTGTTKITAQMDKDVNEQLVTILDNLGIDLSTGINIWARAVIRHGGFPFAVADSTNASPQVRPAKTRADAIKVSNVKVLRKYESVSTAAEAIAVTFEIVLNKHKAKLEDCVEKFNILSRDEREDSVFRSKVDITVGGETLYIGTSTGTKEKMKDLDRLVDICGLKVGDICWMYGDTRVYPRS